MMFTQMVEILGVIIVVRAGITSLELPPTMIDIRQYSLEIGINKITLCLL